MAKKDTAASRQRTYQESVSKYGKWIASKLDGWVCPGPPECDENHKPGRCEVAKVQAQTYIERMEQC